LPVLAGSKRFIIKTEANGRKRTYRLTEKGNAVYRAELEGLRRCVSDAEEDAERAW